MSGLLDSMDALWCAAESTLKAPRVFIQRDCSRDIKSSPEASIGSPPTKCPAGAVANNGAGLSLEACA